MLWSTIKQMYKNTVCSFQEVIFIFLKEGDTASHHMHTCNCRMRGQETGEGNVLDCGCADLCSVVLSTK